MYVIKRLVLLLLFLFAVVDFYAERMHWNQGRGYEPFDYATKNGLFIDNPTDTLRYAYSGLKIISQEFSLNFRARNLNGRPAKKYSYKNTDGKIFNISNPHWGFFITGSQDTLVVAVKGGEVYTAIEPEPCINLNIYFLNAKTKESANIGHSINPYDGENLWNISIDKGKINLSVGNTEINPVCELPWTSDITGFGFYAGWGAKIIVSDIDVEFLSESEIHQPVDFSIEEIDEYLSQSEDQMEGYWVVFDRELEESLLKMGGDYTMFSIKDGEDYKFIYIEGAVVNSTDWQRGDVKIRMNPTPFQGIYEVEWIDSMKSSISKEIKAQRGEGETLTINFPYQSSKVRLRKVPR